MIPAASSELVCVLAAEESSPYYAFRGECVCFEIGSEGVIFQIKVTLCVIER